MWGCWFYCRKRDEQIQQFLEPFADHTKWLDCDEISLSSEVPATVTWYRCKHVQMYNNYTHQVCMATLLEQRFSFDFDPHYQFFITSCCCFFTWSTSNCSVVSGGSMAPWPSWPSGSASELLLMSTDRSYLSEAAKLNFKFKNIPSGTWRFVSTLLWIKAFAKNFELFWFSLQFFTLTSMLELWNYNQHWFPLINYPQAVVIYSCHQSNVA